ncbi:MAG TPA: 2-dehydropantoate 2-reductase [Roseiflexaceae bacterium]|nr:2-dehydropantoate 2-reductase [Roseiflexaceae bacterium]
MRIAIVGAGGVGGFFGGLLAHAGHDVSFLARGAHLDAIRRNGLRIEARQGRMTIDPAAATDDPAAIGQVDLVLLCVKTYSLDGVLPALQVLVGPETAVLTLQNGVEAYAQVAAAVGSAAVLPGVAYCEVAVREPGVIFQGAAVQRIVFGEPAGPPSTRAQRVAEALMVAGVDVVLNEHILGAIWTKCCFICAMSGVTALTRQPLGPLLADAEGRELLLAVMREAHAVALAQGVYFEADPVEAGLLAAERFPPEAKSSMLRDLERGGELEIEALNGAVVRLGRTLGVATPVNQAVYAALRFAQPLPGGRA